MEKMYWMYNGTYSGKYIGNIMEYLNGQNVLDAPCNTWWKDYAIRINYQSCGRGDCTKLWTCDPFLEHYGLQTELLLDNNGLCAESLIMSRNFMHKSCGTR